MNQKTTSTSRFRKYIPLRPILIVLGIVLLVSVLIFRLHKHPNLNDVHVVMKDVSRHYTLPAKETPALATVTDSRRVQSSFAGKVKNGDKILIYQQNKLAIVYRPSTDRIVDVEPVSIDAPPSAQTAK